MLSLGVGSWELGVGSWELGVGRWALTMKYSIVTFGCRVNQADSLRLEEDLRAGGGVESASRDADLASAEALPAAAVGQMA